MVSDVQTQTHTYREIHKPDQIGNMLSYLLYVKEQNDYKEVFYSFFKAVKDSVIAKLKLNDMQTV